MNNTEIAKVKSRRLRRLAGQSGKSCNMVNAYVQNSKPETANSENMLVKGDNLEVLKQFDKAFFELHDNIQLVNYAFERSCCAYIRLF